MPERNRAEGKPYTDSKKPGRLDVHGVEWWASDPYPTWFYWQEVKDGKDILHEKDIFVPWADDPPDKIERYWDLHPPKGKIGHEESYYQLQWDVVRSISGHRVEVTEKHGKFPNITQAKIVWETMTWMHDARNVKVVRVTERIAADKDDEREFCGRCGHSVTVHNHWNKGDGNTQCQLCSFGNICDYTWYETKKGW